MLDGDIMRALLINSVCGIGSTGRICAKIAHQLEDQGYEVRIAFGRDDQVPEEAKKYAVRIGNRLSVKMDALKTRMFDCAGFNSKRETENFLKWADAYNPNLVWLHNIHGYYINIELLFYWLKHRESTEIRWTLHDCWAFTGHCTYFTMANCDRWINGCYDCPQKKEYPASFILDNSKKNYLRKKRLFTGVRNMSIITPSNWLANLVKESFLKEYPVTVIYNTIDHDIFKYRKSDFRARYGIESKFVILGVASPWNERKGMKDFFYVAKHIKNAVIVLVGLTKKQIDSLPDGIIGITRTNSPIELAEIYSAADIFINPTYEDNYPTVNLEAESCMTPVITYSTGGSPETLHLDSSCAVKTGDLNALVDAIQKRRSLKRAIKNQ